jgi:hypothetical protein
MEVRVIKHSDIARCPKQSLLPSHYRDDGTCKCVPVYSDYRPDVKVRIHAMSIERGSEHRELRNAIDAASVEGTTTYIKNSVGAPVAKIAPLDEEDPR